MTNKGIILCVDDEHIILQALKSQLYKEFSDNYIIEVAESAEEGLEILEEMADDGFVPLVIVSDWLMPGMKGDEFLITAHNLYPCVMKVMLSGQADEAAIERTREQADLQEFIHKPWDSEALLNSIKQCITTFNKNNC
jgi:CheY-like chemotaxis protein